MEILAINDASTDNSGEILETFAQKDARIRVTHLKENIGQGFVRNRALEQARGAWVAFLDSDDLMAPSALRQLVESGNTHRADLVLGHFDIRLDKSKGRFERHPVPRVFPEKRRPFHLGEGLAVMDVLSCWSLLHCRAFLESVGARFHRSFYEDGDFMLHLYLEAKSIVPCEDVVFVHHRIRAEGDGEASTMQNRLDARRFSMFAASLEADCRLLEMPRYRARFENLAEIKTWRMSQLLAICLHVILPVTRMFGKGSARAELPRLAAVFAASGLRAGELVTASRYFSSRPLVACGFYRLGLFFIRQKMWRGLFVRTFQESPRNCRWKHR